MIPATVPLEVNQVVRHARTGDSYAIRGFCHVKLGDGVAEAGWKHNCVRYSGVWEKLPEEFVRDEVSFRAAFVMVTGVKQL